MMPRYAMAWSARMRWVAEVVGALNGGVAIDGKTVRGSGSGGETAIHMVSAFATELGVVLGWFRGRAPGAAGRQRATG